jgi:hypothetical protein
MKNKISDLNDHLFAQMERLADEALKGDDLVTEIKRGDAMVDVADQILRSAEIQVAAAKIVAEHGKGDPMALLPTIEGRSRLIENGAGKAKSQ